MSLHSGFRLHKSIPKWTVAYENIDLIEEYGQTDIEEAMALYNESAASFFLKKNQCITANEVGVSGERP
jgi:hypothetical protein